MDPQLTIGSVTLLKLLTAGFSIATIIVWLLIRSLFRHHFRKYRKWIEEEVYTDWRGQLRALREHYDELLDLLQEQFEEGTEVQEEQRITLTRQVKLLADRLAVQEEIFDRVMQGVMFANSVAVVVEKTRDATRRALQRSSELRKEWKHGRR